ncbi:MAG: ATP-dependent helicase [Gracilibacter sp. BRH_c7a]|nr:MAG: ATP-dependent helicase [Gracilibacter sp. BRH_c7a]
MADTKWTNEQLEAITDQDCNLLVAAAAGAGKTAVLVERIIRKITDAHNPLDIDRLLIVTFTNAAATEMRERIARAISAKLEEDSGSPKIQRQLTLLNKASITTIHSFCLEVIRSNFHRIDIDPGFRIADQTEATLMKLEVLSELFEELYENEDGHRCFFELLECYGGNKDDQALQDMILSLYEFIQSSPHPERWLQEMAELFNASEQDDFSQTPCGEVLLKSVKIELQGLKTIMNNAVEIIQGEPSLDRYLLVYQEDLANIEALLKMCSRASKTKWDNIYDELQALSFNRLPPAGKDTDKNKQEYVKDIRDNVKKRLSDIKEKSISLDSKEIYEDFKNLYPLVQCLVGLVTEFSAKYKEKKNKKSIVDFNDLEHFCLQILIEQDEQGKDIPSTTAVTYREQFAEILVDEYQDSNMVQELIVNLISRERISKPNIFMVGDVKQSIYRFRQAKPELFLFKYNKYSSEKGSPSRKITLYKNFRSRPEVVQAINYIFHQIMSENVGELDYTDKEALNPGAEFIKNTKERFFIGGAPELHLIQSASREETVYTQELDSDEAEVGEDSALDEEMLDAIQCEARLVAKRIQALKQPDNQGKVLGIIDKDSDEYREVDYRDIVILLRTTKNWADVFKEELTAQNIPVFTDTGTGFFKTSEIQVILSLLQIIDNPLQDIPLLAVLRSPIVSFTIDELTELRLINRKAPIFEALQGLAEDSGRLSSKAATFLGNLQRWRDMSLYMSVDKLLWQLYMETGYYGIIGALPLGEQRQANLRILFERARQFEETSYKGLFNFINFVDKLKSNRGDMGSAKILGENDNVVRIMSIHKSKGLEFPVVILAGCGKRFNLQDMNKSILYHQELGLGPDMVDHSLRLSYPSIPKQAIRQKIKAETLSEEMRILYVALTRAKEKLIITGAVSDVQNSLTKWGKCSATGEGKLSPYEILNGLRYLDWLIPALLRHQSCSLLRQQAGLTEFSDFLLNHPSVWDTKIWYKNDIVKSQSNEEKDESEFIDWLDGLGESEVDTDASLEINRRLSWEYSFTKFSEVPPKLSVTELKRRLERDYTEDINMFLEDQPSLIKKPLFLEESKGLSPAERGTILHFVMQHLNYKNQDLEAQIETMIANALLTKQQAECVETDRIRRFLESSLGRRLLAANKVNREVRFNIEIPCSEIYQDIVDIEGQDETVLLQGIIDCYFEEADGLVLLDYKTDYVAAGQAQVLRGKYRTQIDYYSRALEMLTGKKVIKKYIYLFWNGEILEYH